MTESKLTISWEKEGHIFCDFRFSFSFQKIDMILLTRPEGGLIGLISLIDNKERTTSSQLLKIGKIIKSGGMERS